MPGSSGRPADWLFSGKATVEINTLNDTLIQGRTRPGLLKRWGCDPPSLPTSDPDYKQQPAKVYLKINRLNDTFISHLLRRPWWQRSPHRALETLDHRGRWLTHCLHTTEGQHWGWGLPLCSPHTGRGLDFFFYIRYSLKRCYIMLQIIFTPDVPYFIRCTPSSYPSPHIPTSMFSNLHQHGHICCSKILFKSFFNTWVVMFKSQSGPFTKLSISSLCKN